MNREQFQGRYNPPKEFMDEYMPQAGRMPRQQNPRGYPSPPQDVNPDGSPDARRSSTWLGTAGRLALGAAMLAPFAGGIGRAAIGVGRGAMGMAGRVAADPRAAMGAAGGAMAGAARAVPGMARQGASAVAGAARNPRAAAGALYAGGKATMGKVGQRYKDFYGAGGPVRGAVDPYLNKARGYFGM